MGVIKYIANISGGMTMVHGRWSMDDKYKTADKQTSLLHEIKAGIDKKPGNIAVFRPKLHSLLYQ